MIDTAARARLERWKQSLLDPTDRLLDVRDDVIAIAIDPVRIAFALAAGSAVALEPGEPGLDAARLRVAINGLELESRMKMLRRAARGARADGEHVLWLALGLVTWRDAGDTPRMSPLVLLWPVELRVERLAAAPDLRPRINDVLLEGLRREHEIVAPK